MSLRKDKSSEKNKAFMRLALELANQNKGLTGLNPSVGCVVTHKDEIISYGKTDINGRPHAEVVALKNNKINFKNSNMYVTLEPCCMCAGTIMQARLQKIYFGAYDEKSGVASSDLNLFNDRRINHQTICVGGIMAENSKRLLQQFFLKKRDKFVLNLTQFLHLYYSRHY